MALWPVPASQLADALRFLVPPLLPRRRLSVVYTVVRSVGVVLAVAALVTAIWSDMPEALYWGGSLGLLASILYAAARHLRARARQFARRRGGPAHSRPCR